QCSQSCSLCFCSTVMAVWENKIPLLTVCLQSIFLLPPEQDVDISLYSKTLRALNKMLHMLVFVYPTASIGEELHSIFHVSSAHGGHTVEGCWEAPQEEEQEKPKQWEDDHEFSLSWTTNTMIIVLFFVKHFYSLEKTDLTLVALQRMRDCSNYSIQVAATLMAVLTVDFKSTPTDVSNRQLLAGGLSPWRGGIRVGLGA
ncbi:hypothetical protein ASZ78_013631, partial [Callipepla squamata]